MGKRIFDITASISGLLILTPLLLLIAVLIKIKMNGPVIFSQERMGRFGKLFTIYKFRTMVLAHNGSMVSVRGESRITPLGKVLRKYKLDELPELWNVVKGDMSFVGPRPDMPYLYENLNKEEKKILELRPGITGPASLRYSNEEELLAGVEDPERYSVKVLWPDKVRLNLEYYYKRSLFSDIRIIFKTVFRSG